MLTISTRVPLTKPLRKRSPYSPAPTPLTTSHVSNAELPLAMIALSLLATLHSADGKTSLNMPTATCCSSGLSSAVCVFRYTFTLTLARVAPAAMNTSSNGSSAPNATFCVIAPAG